MVRILLKVRVSVIVGQGEYIYIYLQLEEGNIWTLAPRVVSLILLSSASKDPFLPGGLFRKISLGDTQFAEGERVPS